jgi:uncharacterized membrane protein YkvA (DUF1232 family)
MFWIIAAAVYVICPLDFDFIPIAGWVDDWIVAYMCYRKYRDGVAVTNSEVVDVQIVPNDVEVRPTLKSLNES